MSPSWKKAYRGDIERGALCTKKARGCLLMISTVNDFGLIGGTIPCMWIPKDFLGNLYAG